MTTATASEMIVTLPGYEPCRAMIPSQLSQQVKDDPEQAVDMLAAVIKAQIRAHDAGKAAASGDGEHGS